MFDALSDRFEGIFKRLRGKGRLAEQDVDEALREIRRALLEADVNVRVARSVVDRIGEEAISLTRSQVLNPSQQVIKIVNQELVTALGGEALKITYAPRPPTVVLMAGLQGSGKTTNAGKLARWFKQQGRNPLLVGADLQRPAAVEQLRTLGRQVDVPVFSAPGDPVETAGKGVDEARRIGRDGGILGMGDMLTLIEKAEQVYEKDEAEKAAAKLFEGDFTFDDFLDQLQQVRKMGPLGNLVGMIPGLPKEMKNQEIDDREINRIEAIIRSMTPIERANPLMIDGSRRSRIAAGSGTAPGDVSGLIKQFQDVKKMMQKMGNIPGLGRKMKKGKGKGKAGG